MHPERSDISSATSREGPDRPDHLPDWPSVSVVILNYNGQSHLETCLQSVRASRYPGDLEILVVDNGSTDGSLAYLREILPRDPRLRLLSLGRNTGFARGNNLGAREARGEYVVFLNNDTRVDPDWLRHLLTPMDPAAGRICTGAKILSWDGRRIDFVGGRLTFSGHGIQKDLGEPHVEGVEPTPRPIPFACGAAMAVHRATFLDVGGFDPLFFAGYEDVDLGYRLWALGYEVWLVPQAVVYHHLHGTSGRFPAHQRLALNERNALAFLLKNFEEATLREALPAALLLLIERSFLASGVNRRDFELGRTDPSALAETATVPKEALGYLWAVDRLLESLPQLWEKREEIQRRRVRPDREILRRFPQGLLDPLLPHGPYRQAQEHVIATLGLPTFEGKGTMKEIRLLLLSHQNVGPQMAGPAIRYWEMARALSPHLRVTLGVHGDPGLEGEGFQVRGYDRLRPDSVLPLLQEADVVLAMGYLVHELPALRRLNKPLIVDLYAPFPLESLELHRDLPLEEQEAINRANWEIVGQQLAAGDFFLCASERQRDFWLGMLAARGRINPHTYGQDPTLRRLIDVVPFGLPDEPPAAGPPLLKGVHPGIGPEDRVILWGGGMWDWLDPLTLVRALARVVEARPDVKLVFATAPEGDRSLEPSMRRPAEVELLARELGLWGRHVFRVPWTPYPERGRLLREADLGVSLHATHLEARFAFRTRVLDFLWAGVPMVLTQGDVLADEAARAGVAETVPPGDPEATARAILRMLERREGEEERAALEAAFEALRARYRWSRAVEPILRFCARPLPAPDRSLRRQEPPPGAGDVDPSLRARLPKAWALLRQGGLGALWAEGRRYWRWRRELRKVRGRNR